MSEKQMISDTAIISQATSLVAAEMDGEIVMLSIDNGKYYGMDAVGSKIWNLVNEPLSFSDLIGILINEYDVGVEQCKNDILNFLQYLDKENLINID